MKTVKFKNLYEYGTCLHGHVLTPACTQKCTHAYTHIHVYTHECIYISTNTVKNAVMHMDHVWYPFFDFSL